LFSGQRPENKKNQLYKVNLIARATIFVTYVKLQLFSEKVLFYSLPSFMSAGIFGGSTAKNKKKHLCVLRVSAVKTIWNHVGSVGNTILPPKLTSYPSKMVAISRNS
jgi:hypothetical protein